MLRKKDYNVYLGGNVVFAALTTRRRGCKKGSVKKHTEVQNHRLRDILVRSSGFDSKAGPEGIHFQYCCQC